MAKGKTEGRDLVVNYSTEYEARLGTAWSSALGNLPAARRPKTDKVAIENYLPIDSGGVNEMAAYLVLKKKHPEIAKAVAAYTEAGLQKRAAIKAQDFEKAANIREAQEAIFKGLINLLNG